MAFETVKELVEHLKQHPPLSPDQKEFGRVVLLYLKAREKREATLIAEVRSLRSDLTEVIKTILGEETTEATTAKVPAAAKPAGAASAVVEETEEEEEGIPAPDVVATQPTSVVPNAVAPPPPTMQGTPGAPPANGAKS